MKYDLPWLIQRLEHGERIKFLFFWGHQARADGQLTSTCFSQWWPCEFSFEGINYHSSEQWMMAQKAILFNDMQIFEMILDSKTPAQVKELGRKVKNFEDAMGEANRFNIVVEGNILKFKQNHLLKNFLLNTNGRIIVEASPVDRIWGIGLTADSIKSSDPTQWNGLNLLGFALTKVRDILKA